MKRLSIDEYYLKMLKLVAARSTCRRRSVGAILVNKKNQVLSTGYNGVPSGRAHCLDSPCPGADDPAGDTSRCEAIHAEQNALLQCRDRDQIETLYVSDSPCFVCAKMLLNTSLKRVVTSRLYADGLGWKLLASSGIGVGLVEIDDDDPYTTMVREFAEKHGFPRSDVPELLDESVRLLRLRLVVEEAGELASALNDGNLIETADALGDLLYVTVGAALTFGIPLLDVVREIHRSNMTKGVKRDATAGTKGGLKEETYLSPDLKKVLSGGRDEDR